MGALNRARPHFPTREDILNLRKEHKKIGPGSVFHDFPLDGRNKLNKIEFINGGVK
jgi:hypothetical protein